MHLTPLIGNDSAKSFLRNLLKDSATRQVLLFSGPPRVGKTAFAVAFLQDFLGKEHAVKIAAENHPDVKWIRPEGKTKLHSVAAIKEMLEEVSLVPYEANKKVYVIEDAERMLPAASNTLLKILEEPPAHILFVLLTAHEEEMLPTILSRCTKVPFYPIGETSLIEALQAKTTDSRQIAIASGGSFSRALELLEGVEDPIKTQFLEIVSRFFLKEPSQALLVSLDSLDKLIEKKEEEAASQIVDLLFADLLFWVRDLHYIKIEGNSDALFHIGHLIELERQAQGEIPSLEKMYFLIEEARLALQRYSKPKVVLERLFYLTEKSLR